MEKIQRLMNYSNVYSKSYVIFSASDMQLMVDSDAAYLVLPNARSRIVGYFRIANKPTNRYQYKYHGSILIKWNILRHVVTSAVEAETKGVFHNAKMSLPIHCILNEMEYLQNPAPKSTANTNITGFVHNNMVMKN